MKAKVIFFICIFIIIGMPARPQNKRMIFKGHVLDRELFFPLKGANIRVEGTRKGVVSDNEGSFSLTIYNVPVFLTVSHVGYETQRIWLDQTTTAITVLMAKATSNLPEIEIKSKTDPTPFFKDNKYAVLDYEVDSGMVFLLTYRSRMLKSELLCKSLSGDTLALSGLLTFKPTGLFHDCLGNMHVLSADSAYQLYRHDGLLELIYPVEINRFYGIMPGCVASTSELLFVRKVSPDGQIVLFSAIDRKTRTNRFLQASRDEVKLKMLHDSPYDLYLLLMDSIPGNPYEAAYMQWLKKIIYKPNTSTLHKIGDLMCVFNTTDYTLSFYMLSGEFTSKLKMPVEKIDDGKWTTEIYIDNIKNKVYTTFRKGGRFTLYRIDLNNGELKRQFSSVHDFPRKIRVHDNHLFYLYDVPGEGDNKHLFRQKL